MNCGEISYTSSSVDVTGNEKVGGIIGYGHGTISNSTSSGDIIGYDTVGCIAGAIWFILPVDCNSTGTYNCTKTPSCYEGCPHGYFFD